VKEDQCGDLESLHKACQAAITDGGLFTDTGVDERCENERQGENDCEMKTCQFQLVTFTIKFHYLQIQRPNKDLG